MLIQDMSIHTFVCKGDITFETVSSVFYNKIILPFIKLK